MVDQGLDADPNISSAGGVLERSCSAFTKKVYPNISSAGGVLELFWRVPFVSAYPNISSAGGVLELTPPQIVHMP